MLNIKNVFKQKIRANDREKIQEKAIIELKKNKYIFIRKLGSGYYGDVISVKSKIYNMPMAAKVTHKDVTSFGELYLWKRLKHPNIISLLDIIHRDEVHIFLMPQLAGSLVYALEHPLFREKEEFFELTIDWMRDMISGLEYLHSNGMCHLDIKSDNILISHEFRAVLSDFSALTQTKNPVDRYVLPKYYCPPEAWSSVKEERPKVDGASFDVWAAGMIFFYCFSNRDMERQLWGRQIWMIDIYPLMFNCLQEPYFTELIKKSHPHSKISDVNCSQALNILRGILRYNAKDRPMGKDILNHPLLSKRLRPGNLFDEDVVWIQNQREVKYKIQQFNEPMLLEVDVQNDKRNLKYHTLDEFLQKVDAKKVMFQDGDIIKESENAAKILTSKDPDIYIDESVRLITQQETVNLSNKRDSEIRHKMPHETSNNISEPVGIQDTYTIKESKDTAKEMPLDDGDINENEKVSFEAQDESIKLDNNTDSEKMPKMLSKTPDDISELMATHSYDIDEKRNSAHRISTVELSEEEMKTANRCKKKKSPMFDWFQKKFLTLSKIFSRTRN